MLQITVRNDDVSHDIDLDEFKAFCEVCDKYNVKLLQCITPRGQTLPIEHSYTNQEIIERFGDGVLSDNKELLDYLKSRNDLIAVHGYYHTHYLSADDILRSKQLIESWGLKPTYYVPPFNEYKDRGKIWGLEINVMSMDRGERLEDYLVGMPRHGQIPPEFTYLHSWRFFKNKWYSLESLDNLLWKITNL